MSEETLKALIGAHETASEAQTLALAASLARALPRPALVLLEGELGAGKTRFAKGLASALGIDPAQVTSPTFTLMSEHEGEGGQVLVHVDAYRLDPDADDDPSIEIVTRHLFGERAGSDARGALCVIEWPDRLRAQLEALGFAGVTVRVRLDHLGPTSRLVEVSVDHPGSPGP